MNVRDFPDFDQHEDVRFFDFQEVGAQAVIAVHSTHLGPAVGGCRVWRYAKPELGLTDALRLSRGMSYKNAMADLPFGGGKAVIMLPDHDFDRRALFEAYGRAVDSLGGRYITAEDVGSSVADMEVVATQTPYVGGLPTAGGKAGGDPSPWTALGVFLSIEAVVRLRLGRSLQGVKVAIQGTGAVGAGLARRLADAGCILTLADINFDRAQALAEELGAYCVAPEQIHRVDADVYAPCALGGSLNAKTIVGIRASIVCGAANNQLADPSLGLVLQRRGVTYCPDFVVNAGGIIAIHGESVGWSMDQVEAKVRQIPGRLTHIIQNAKEVGVTPEFFSQELARERIGRSTAMAEAV